jgi:hypothetical protein
MNQQALLLIRFVLTTLAGILVSRGLMSQATADWLGSPETLVIIGALGGFASLAWGWWSTRPKAVIASAGTLLEGKGAIIAPAPIADSTATPTNVVKSASEAASLPGVKA